MVEARTALKKSVRHFRYECKKQKKRKRLLDLKYKNAKDNWKLFKDSQHSDSSLLLSASKLHNNIKSINDPNTVFNQKKTFYILMIVSSNQKYKSCLHSWMLKYLKKK